MSSEPDDFDLPQPLADALRTAFTPHTDIPTRVDQAILAAARARFDQRRRLRMTLRWGAGLAAGLAAVITLAVLLRPAPPTTPVAKGDVNTDGQVNMVDALALARHLSAKDTIDPAWDVNRDGKVDQSDVQTLATAAVSLKQAGVARRLPKFNELGIDVALASASGIVSKRENVPLAKASPTKTNQEGTQ